jgi:hypothetical protein
MDAVPTPRPVKSGDEVWRRKKSTGPDYLIAIAQILRDRTHDSRGQYLDEFLTMIGGSIGGDPRRSQVAPVSSTIS